MIAEKKKSLKQFLQILFASLIVIILAIMIICFLNKPPETLNDIAYDINQRYGYTVYIEEETGYQPYLVLTRNYEGSGNVLLLRKYVLDERQPYNDPEREISYYENSYIDEYLNTVYINMLKKSLQDEMLEMDIRILNDATYDAIKNGAEAKILNRKAFLLSYAEVSRTAEKRDVLDGQLLEYFEKGRSQLEASDSKGARAVWMLRSPSLVYPTTSMAVTGEGKIGLGGGVEGLRGVRPAFCLSGDLKIEQRDQIEEDGTVFVMSEDN